jgi:hypothetical protein
MEHFESHHQSTIASLPLRINAESSSLKLLWFCENHQFLSDQGRQQRNLSYRQATTSSVSEPTDKIV